MISAAISSGEVEGKSYRRFGHDVLDSSVW